MVKFLCLLLTGEQIDLVAQASFFRYAVKSYYFAYLSRLALFKLFRIFDAGLSHKSQDEDYGI
jgi:hypothetical protein